MIAIKHATQPMNQTPYKPLKIISQQNFKHMDPKHTHTNTQNKSNKFYISKNKSR